MIQRMKSHCNLCGRSVGSQQVNMIAACMYWIMEFAYLTDSSNHNLHKTHMILYMLSFAFTSLLQWGNLFDCDSANHNLHKTPVILVMLSVH
jgi:hypothetical protein